MGNTINRENTLLASFLFLDDLGFKKDEVFKLNSEIFTSSYRRATANKINDETDTDKMYGFLSVTLEEHTKGTKFEQDWIDIIAQTPLILCQAKRIHDDLKTEHKERIAKAFR